MLFQVQQLTFKFHNCEHFNLTIIFNSLLFVRTKDILCVDDIAEQRTFIISSGCSDDNLLKQVHNQVLVVGQ